MGSFSKPLLVCIAAILTNTTFSAKSNDDVESIIQTQNTDHQLIWRSSLPNNFYISNSDRAIQLFSGNLSKPELLKSFEDKTNQYFLNNKERTIFKASCNINYDKVEGFKAAKDQLFEKINVAGFSLKNLRKYTGSQCILEIADLEKAKDLAAWKPKLALYIADYHKDKSPAEANLIAGQVWAIGKSDISKTEGVNFLLSAGEAGKVDAYNLLGILYSDGKLRDRKQVVEPDFAMSKKYYELASKGGNQWANTNIGIMYYNGKVTEQNLDKALEYLLKGIAEGNGHAAAMLFDLLAKKGSTKHFEQTINVIKDPGFIIKTFETLKKEKLSTNFNQSTVLYQNILESDLSGSNFIAIEDFKFMLKAHIGNHELIKDWGLKLENNSEAKIYYDYKYNNSSLVKLAKLLELEQKNLNKSPDDFIYDLYLKAAKNKNFSEYNPAQNWLGKKACEKAGIKIAKKPKMSPYVVCYEGLVEKSAKGLGILSYAIKEGNSQGFIKDEKKAFEYKLQAAKKGYDHSSYFDIGLAFHLGKNTDVDYKQAHFWYTRYIDSAKTNKSKVNSDVYNNLGILFKNGQGVEKDLGQAFNYFTLGDGLNSKYATANLATMWEEGLFVKVNTNEAIRLYKKANVEFGNKRLTSLHESQKCESNASTSLFSLKLNCAVRSQFRNAIKATSAVVKREKDNYWGDVYKTSKVLKGSDELYIEYTNNNKFAFAQYKFPSHMNTNTVVNVKDFVSQKYGNYHKSSGTPSVGEVEYNWTLNDGIELRVFRGWPDTTTYLTFKHKANKKSVDEAISEAKRKKEAEQYKSQTNAF